MECKDCNGLLLEALRGELDGARGAQLREHLEACAGCREEAEACSILWRDLDWEVPAPPERLQSMIRRLESAANPARDPASRRELPWFQRLWPARPAVALAYSCCLLLSGIVLGDGLQPVGRLLGGDLDQRISAGRLEASDLSPDSLVRLCSVPARDAFQTL